MNFENKLRTDTTYVLDFIKKHPMKEHIISMYRKGPPEGKGFMWVSEDGSDSLWTPKECEALKIMKRLILCLEWESSGYGFFQRNIQRCIRDWK
mgnify:CR=1 FL=1